MISFTTWGANGHSWEMRGEWLVSVLLSCGGSVSVPAEDAGADVAQPSEDAADAGGDAASDAPVIACWIDAAPLGWCPGMFPTTFDKSCNTDTDCAIAFHQVACCGTELAMGINSAQLAAFDAAEKAWRAKCPPCDCPKRATGTESSTCCFNPSVAVRCAAGQCRTGCP